MTEKNYGWLYADLLEQGEDKLREWIAQLPRRTCEEDLFKFYTAQAEDWRRGEALKVERAAEAARAQRLADIAESNERARNSPEGRRRAEQLERELQRQHEESTRHLIATMNEAMDRYLHTKRLEWTEELLGTSFALGDGTQTTWGDATVEQHRYRLEMHRANAVAGFEGAARHEVAIGTIIGKGARTLNEALAVSR